MYIFMILFFSFPSIHSTCYYASEWFNENQPWNAQLEGNDVERFSIIQPKYPLTFEITPWTGAFEIETARFQPLTDENILIENYTMINDGFICQAINGKQCRDYEIRFCLKDNPCSLSLYPPDENSIVHSTEAQPHSLPWHVSIQYQEDHICSGTLIDEQHILTAAACFQNNLIPIGYSVVLGVHYLSDSTNRISVDRFIFHSDYNHVTLANNIALVRLSRPIQSFSEHIRPACIAKSMRQPNVVNPLLAAGWRMVSNDTWSVTITDELRLASAIVRYECPFVYEHYDSEQQICIGTKGSERDLCQGDEGSGLFEKQKYDIDRWILSGILNYGCEYAIRGHPVVYTRVSAYYNWIQDAIHRMDTNNQIFN